MSLCLDSCNECPQAALCSFIHSERKREEGYIGSSQQRRCLDGPKSDAEGFLAMPL
jgi:hypothetical protein